MKTLTFYVVRNKDGQYLRAKGYNGYGQCWTELEKAKIYTKIGVAKGQITWWSNNYPKFGIPELIPLVAELGEPIDQTERISKAQKAKLKLEIRLAEENLESAKKSWEKHKTDNTPFKKVINSEKILNELKAKLEKYEN